DAHQPGRQVRMTAAVTRLRRAELRPPGFEAAHRHVSNIYGYPRARGPIAGRVPPHVGNVPHVELLAAIQRDPEVEVGSGRQLLVSAPQGVENPAGAVDVDRAVRAWDELGAEELHRGIVRGPGRVAVGSPRQGLRGCIRVALQKQQAISLRLEAPA